MTSRTIYPCKKMLIIVQTLRLLLRQLHLCQRLYGKPNGNRRLLNTEKICKRFSTRVLHMADLGGILTAL